MIPSFSHLSEVVQVSKVFMRLGLTGFGGPLAAMAMMEEELCRRRAWISAPEFTTLYATCKVLPGPIATQMAIGLGRKRAGTVGGIFAGFFFILPAFIIMLALAWTYAFLPAQRPGWFEAGFGGLQAGAIAIIAISIFSLARPLRKRLDAWVIGATSAAIVGFDPSLEPWVIAVFGVIGATKNRTAIQQKLRVAWPTVLALAWVCFKAGAFVFGSGLAIVPLLEAEVVQHFQWMTHSQFMDALALSQVTPGPIVKATTFIGFQAAGLVGAVTATVAVFLPGFLNMLILVPMLLRQNTVIARMEGFSAWAIPAVVGAVAAVLVRLSWVTLDSRYEWIGLSVALAVSIFAKAPAWASIPLAGVAAAAFSFL